MTAPLRDCFDHGAPSVSFETARRAAAALARPLGRSEPVALAAARGRILAEDIVAPIALPPFDQAAMDGYALRAADPGGVPLLLPVSGRTDAGDPPAVLAAGTAHRVMTGAALPAGANTVVMQEQVSRRGGLVQLGPAIAPDMNIRRRGEDVRQGAVVLRRGDTLGWPEIALLGALGIAGATVASPIRIGIVTTGSELRRHGEPLAAGAIFDANGPMLAALLGSANAVVTTTTVGDELQAITGALAAIAGSADLVITTAGMAAGERDHMREAILRAGGHFDVVKVAMKPGKPLAIGRLQDACFIGLPGNPQAAACGALAFVRPLMASLLGQADAPRLTAVLGFSCGGKPGRTELVPVSLETNGGHLTAHRCGPEGSHRLVPLARADAIAVVPGQPAAGTVGAIVELLPIGRMGEPGFFGTSLGTDSYAAR